MSILLVPETSPGRGSGHIRRSLFLLDEIPSATMYLEETGERVASLLTDASRHRVTNELVTDRWQLIVLDKFRLTREELRRYDGAGALVGLDLGGSAREYCDYLIDTLPRLDDSEANVSDRALLRLPAHGPTDGRVPGSILVSYGGEDPAKLTEPTVQALLEAGVPPDRITVVLPTMRVVQALPPGLRRFRGLPSLYDLLRTHEWVFTSFGMTAYEAANSGCLVVTIAPTPYHDRLARQEGFARVDPRRLNSRSVRRLLEQPRATAELTGNLVVSELRSLPLLLASLRPSARRGSPARGENGPAIWRGTEKSYFRCPSTSLVYMERLAGEEERYGSSYFDEEYRAQYGKSYLEDFDSIRAAGTARLNRIAGKAKPPATLLDVGCAYGPFLAAATDRGYDAFGLDVSPDAIRHVTDELGLPALCGSFLDDAVLGRLPRREFDVVTLWYVIEHFADLDLVLDRLRSILRPGGVLALSTPHGAGVSARRNTSDFYERSPRDHFTVWDRRSARLLLSSFGFTSIRFRVTGHHPERYPSVRSGKMPVALALAHSRAFGRGDTFEVYAIRE